MTKPIFLFLSLCVGSIGFGALHRAINQIRMASSIRHEQWQAASNGLAATRAAMLAAQAEVLDKRGRLLQARRHPALSPELLLLLEKDGVTGHSVAWAELRQQLGIGWDTSPDYVLVRKQVLKQLNYPLLFGASRASDFTCGLFGLSPAEQSALEAVLGRIRGEQSLIVQRAEPHGDVVAQYTMPAVDPSSAQTLSNRFAAELTSVVGPERADFLAPEAWRQLSFDLAPPVANAMIIRKTLVVGEPDLICEMSDGGYLMPVRYGRYPASWFLTLFPEGWKGLAEQEGFQLPPNCQRPPFERETVGRDSKGAPIISIVPTNAP
jgi:hypothetical protein